MFTKLTGMTKTVEELNTKIREAAREELKPALAEACEIFKTEIPELEAITWNQYTPYFNDGEACEFSVGNMHAVTEEDSSYISTWSSGKVGSFSAGKSKLLRKFATSLETLEEALEICFGDHATVTINIRTGDIDVEEYDHD